MKKIKPLTALTALLLLASVFILVIVYDRITDGNLYNASKVTSLVAERMKTRLVNHRYLVENDEVKSLVHLVQKTQEASAREADRMSSDFLAEYLEEQQISGVVILDGELNELWREARNDVGDWTRLAPRHFVADILQHPAKSFSNRLMLDGRQYDVAAVSRRIGPGIVLAWVRRAEIGWFDEFFDLYEGDPFALDTSVFVVKDDLIEATNMVGWNRRLAKDCPWVRQTGHAAPHDLTEWRVDDDYWYGRVLQIQDYKLYVMAPASTVFQTRSELFAQGCFFYALVVVLLMLVRQRTRRRYLEELNTQYETVHTIASIFVSCYHVQCGKNTVEIIQATENIRRLWHPGMTAEQFFERELRRVIDVGDLEAALAFFNVKTIAARLEGTSVLSETFRLYDGRWVEVLSIPQSTDEAGRVTSCLFLSRDISDEKYRELMVLQQLKSAAESAKSATVAKIQFLRHMSHDVRTPINGIRGMVEIARRSRGDAERVDYCLEKIWSVSGTLLELVNDVLDMSKLEAGGEKPETVTFNLETLLQEICDTTDVIARKCQVKVDWYFDGAVRVVSGSRKHLRRVYTNIIYNAVKFTPAGGEVTFGCRVESSGTDKVKVCFSCRDTGCGMSEAFQKHVFEPFSQEAGAARTEYVGTGLGLVITKQLTELMGGTIAFTSRQGKGTTFTVEVPFEAVRTEDAAQDRQIEKEVPDLAGLRVLLVEDNELNREIARYFLTEAGMKVEEAENGQVAVDMFRQSAPGQFDVVLMDIMMPVMDGLQACRAIRALPREDASSVPIVAMSANAFVEDRDAGLQSGFTDYLTKPVESDKLVRKIAQYCHRA